MPEQKPEIKVYGRENCDVCNRFKKRIEDMGFSYEFLDFDQMMDWNTDWRARRAQDVGAAYHFFDQHLPVISVNGEYLSYAGAINKLREK